MLAHTHCRIHWNGNVMSTETDTSDGSESQRVGRRRRRRLVALLHIVVTAVLIPLLYRTADIVHRTKSS